MSDRRRRWMCQLIFVVACLLPTAWVGLRIVYQPGPEHFARQLQLQLGVPVRMERVTTPTPDLTILHGVSFQHPETGTWATADRWSLCWVDSPQHARWQIDQLRLDEATLPDLFEHLHRTVLRQQLAGASAASSARVPLLPTLHVQSLEVLSRDPALASSPAPPLALRLQDVTLTWQWNAAQQRPRLEVAAKLLPPRRDRDVLSAGVAAAEVPILCYVERRPEEPATSSPANFATHWEFAVLERPVPVSWIHLQAWPAALRSASTAARFQGLVTGRTTNRGWRIDCRQAQAHGWDLSDLLQYATAGHPSRTQAPLHLQIQHLAWVGGSGERVGWESARLESAQLELSAENGELAADLVLAATHALTLPANGQAIRQVSHAVATDDSSGGTALAAGDPLADLSVRFAQMHVGLRWEAGQLWLRPLSGSDGPLPLLLGYHGQDLVGWSDSGERLWQAESGRTTRAAPSLTSEPGSGSTPRPIMTDGTLPLGNRLGDGAGHVERDSAVLGLAADQASHVDSAEIADVAVAQPRQWLDPRQPLRIAPVDLAWQPQQFIVGERAADPFPFDPLANPQTILRDLLENSALDAASDDR